MPDSAGGSIWGLVAEARRQAASKLHLSAGQPPRLRLASGDLVPDGDAVDPGALDTWIRGVLGEDGTQTLSHRGDCDVVVFDPDGAKCRVAVFSGAGSMNAVVHLS